MKHRKGKKSFLSVFTTFFKDMKDTLFLNKRRKKYFLRIYVFCDSCVMFLNCKSQLLQLEKFNSPVAELFFPSWGTKVFQLGKFKCNLIGLL